mmetsp:Transcript_52879/g.134143  ORF Transcript_52879/g.134143 Transcript_52879/m.134143 type:complete len:244 (-) Transcript_52879:692-1423(-)
MFRHQPKAMMRPKQLLTARIAFSDSGVSVSMRADKCLKGELLLFKRMSRHLSITTMMMQNIMVIARAPITSASGAFSVNAARVFQTMALYNIQAKDMAVARWQILPDRPGSPLRERTYRMTAKSAIKAVIVPAKKGIARSSSACVKCPLRTGISPVLQNMMAWLVRKPMTTMAPSSSASSTKIPQSGNTGPFGPASATNAPLPKLMHERSAGRSSLSGFKGAPQGHSGGLPNISLRAPLEAQR